MSGLLKSMFVLVADFSGRSCDNVFAYVCRVDSQPRCVPSRDLLKGRKVVLVACHHDVCVCPLSLSPSVVDVPNAGLRALVA